MQFALLSKLLLQQLPRTPFLPTYLDRPALPARASTAKPLTLPPNHSFFPPRLLKHVGESSHLSFLRECTPYLTRCIFLTELHCALLLTAWGPLPTTPSAFRGCQSIVGLTSCLIKQRRERPILHQPTCDPCWADSHSFCGAAEEGRIESWCLIERHG